LREVQRNGTGESQITARVDGRAVLTRTTTRCACARTCGIRATCSARTGS
jgi:hypothetical protein